MPILPAAPAPEPHRHRDAAESFGIDPERYDRARPRYPRALVEAVIAASPGPDLLDVGCGTGIAARQFQGYGRAVLGVEPDTRMAEFARRGGVDVEVATFEDWDPAGRRFDAVVAGTAWHWIDPAAGPAKAAQVLRPGGLLAPFWQVCQPPTSVTEALAAVYQRVVPDSAVDVSRLGTSRTVDAYQPMFARAADGIRAAGGFDEPQQWRFTWERHYTRDEWLDELPTSGVLTRLAPERLAELLAAVGAAIDALGGGFTAPYTAVAVTAVRAEGDGRPA